MSLRPTLVAHLDYAYSRLMCGFPGRWLVLLVAAAGVAAAQNVRRAEGERPASTARHEFQIARLIWSNSGGMDRGFGFGGGRPWWAIDYPEAEFHFIQGIRRLTRIDTAEDSIHLRATDEALFDYPWLFAQQVGRWQLSDEEAAGAGVSAARGFLVVDDFHGPAQWEIFHASIRRVFPDRAIVDLPEDDEILHVLYDLDERTQIPGRRHLYRGPGGETLVDPEGSPPTWRGIHDDDGRLMVVMNFNMDMGDSWEHADDPVYPEPMTRGLSLRDQLHPVCDDALTAAPEGSHLRREQLPEVAKALEFRALPDGSWKNIVACSPTSPLKRMPGSMPNFTPAARSVSASACQRSHSSTTPKCGTGTSCPSTGLYSGLRAVPEASRCATSWWPNRSKSIQCAELRPSGHPSSSP